MAGDRHVGVPRCLHPQERREFISAGDFGRPRERCLDCRAVRERRLQRDRELPFDRAHWAPWVSAGEQVKQALLAQGTQASTVPELGGWVDLAWHLERVVAKR